MIEATNPQAVLFDLDGTLVDTAPDLVATLMHLRTLHGLEPLDEQAFRSHASRGALGLLEVGFADQAGFDPGSLRQQFLDHYAANLWVRSRPFEGIEALLCSLKAEGVALAVVTNKIASLALPVIESAGWQTHFRVVVAGDTTANPKPSADPVIEACRRLGVDPASALMVGDDRRDVLAGRSAGTATLVAGWGYLPVDEDPGKWGADGVISTPSQLQQYLPMKRRID